MVIFVVVAVSAAAGGGGYGDNQQQQKWWKWMSSNSAASSSVVNPVVSSSIVLPLYGNVYPIGYYYVQLNIGQPSRPFFLDPDICSTPRGYNVMLLCSLHKSASSIRKPNNDSCHARTSVPPCTMLITNVRVQNNVTISGAWMKPRLALGCGYDQLPGQSHHPLDGVLGLGKGKASIVSQLHSKGLKVECGWPLLGVVEEEVFFFGDEGRRPFKTINDRRNTSRTSHLALPMDGNPELFQIPLNHIYYLSKIFNIRSFPWCIDVRMGKSSYDGYTNLFCSQRAVSAWEF
ncbi:hypothetical protein HAX54_017302 [Datura stramonium]|uniref:Xylanase inhibitor N-terminal domain-containing protein n=1 Tax=Datura stramonium TaxID=4076 RepID=A0ABS8UKP0_DATST|nr:hypothetical protein [Datura stramonium]